MIRWLAILALLAGPAMAQQNAVPGLYGVQGVAADDVLNVRAEPTASAPILSRLSPDATGLEIVALSDNLRWGQINVGETAGWVAMRYMAQDLGRAAGQFPSPARCFGTEPFWTLSIAEGALRFDRMDELIEQFGASHRETALGRQDRWSARAILDDRSVVVTIATASCNDGMSDREYGLSANVLLSRGPQHAHYTGCCSLVP